MDTVLPFGLRLAPKIFNALADALEWTTLTRGASYLKHYLDDFVTTGHPHTQECKPNLDLLVDTSELLGMQLTSGKAQSHA